MIEFAAGISVGALLGLVAGLLIAQFMTAAPAARQEQRDELAQPQQLPWPQPYPYQPPVIVLAAPRERVQVEQQGTSLAQR